MKALVYKQLIFALFFSFCFITANAAGNKIYEIKITANPEIASGGNSETAVFAGTKNLNFINLSNGKMLMDKTYKDAGSSVTKATDASFSDDKLLV